MFLESFLDDEQFMLTPGGMSLVGIEKAREFLCGILVLITAEIDDDGKGIGHVFGFS